MSKQTIRIEHAGFSKGILINRSELNDIQHVEWTPEKMAVKKCTGKNTGGEKGEASNSQAELKTLAELQELDGKALTIYGKNLGVNVAGKAKTKMIEVLQANGKVRSE